MSYGCEGCQDVSGRFSINAGADFSLLLRVLTKKMEDGLLIEDSLLTRRVGLLDQKPFSEIISATPWPNQMDYFFRCLACRKVYRLYCEFLDGKGGYWDAFDEKTAVQFEVILP